MRYERANTHTRPQAGIVLATAFLALALLACASDPAPAPTPAATSAARGVEAAVDTAAPPTGTDPPPADAASPTHTERPSATRTHTPAPTLTAPATATHTRPPAPTNTRPAPTSTLPPEPTNTLPPPSDTPAGGGQLGTVVGVVDGDTIDVNINGLVYRVRYIGINTPETNQTCGSDATAANAGMVSGQTVSLVKDVSETDRFGRLLRYVYVGSLFVNAELVSRGYAEAVAYPPDVRFADYFESLEAQARAANLACYATGVFGGFIVPTATPETAPPPPPTQPSAPTQAGNCSPAYPGVCIPPPPPDLDCGDIPYRRFQVLPPDPHGFDGDNDGIGCES